MDFPNIVIKGSELQLPFQACLKVSDVLFLNAQENLLIKIILKIDILLRQRPF